MRIWRTDTGMVVRDWCPIGMGWRDEQCVCDLKPGMLLAVPFTPVRVVEVKPLPEDRWTDEERAWLGRVTDERWRAQRAPHALTVRPKDAPWPTVNTHQRSDRHLRTRGDVTVTVLPDRYPVCSCCGQLVPCQTAWAEQQAAEASAHADRYATPGVCPACQEPVSHRQQQVVFPHNLHSPVGPPLVFHTRRKCRSSAILYEDRYVTEHPDWPRLWPICHGHTTTHIDETYTCTAGHGVCPGPHARHGSRSTCRDPGCPAGCASHQFDCRLDRAAQFRDDSGALLP